MAERHNKELNQRQYEVDKILKISKVKSTIDLCFLVDCTGSMRPYLNAMTAQIHQLAGTIFQLYILLNLIFKTALLVYKNLALFARKSDTRAAIIEFYRASKTNSAKKNFPKAPNLLFITL